MSDYKFDALMDSITKTIAANGFRMYFDDIVMKYHQFVSQDLVEEALYIMTRTERLTKDDYGRYCIVIR